MAFTEAQRVAIRKYTGWPAYKSYDTRLESVMDLVGTNVDQQAAVEAVLARLVLIETEIQDQFGFTNMAKAEELGLDPKRESKLRNMGRRECQTLGILLNTELVGDAFSVGWSGGAMPMG